VTPAGIAGFRLVARDGDGLARFYAAIGCEVDDARPVAAAELALLGVAGGATRRPLRVGAVELALDAFDRPGAPYPTGTDAASPCFQHLALMVADVGAAWERARAAGAVPISRDGPVTLPASSGGVTAIKFRDPEGHPLELIHFPDRPAAGPGLLGIDHSALVATDLAASERFYAGLGLARGDATLNQGAGQDALDGLDWACADVVPMRPAAAPPHVELLHYRRPAARPVAPWGVADVAATRIVWRGGAPALLRDPDGHLHQLGG